jgi:hypothetical protein
MTEFRGPAGSDGPDESLVVMWALINAAQHRLLVLALARYDGAVLSEGAMVLGMALAELEYVAPALPAGSPRSQSAVMEQQMEIGEIRLAGHPPVVHQPPRR